MDPIARIAELEAQMTAVLATIATKDATIAAKEATIADLTAKLQAMEARLSAMQRRVFGRSSEQLHDPGQQVIDLLGKDPLPFACAAPVAEAAAASQEPVADAPAARGPRGKRLSRLPEHVELVERLIDVPADERIGADGQALVRISEEVTERLDYIPSHYRRLRLVRPVYGRPFVDGDDQPRVVAPPPAFLVAKGLPTDALVIQVLLAKYACEFRKTVPESSGNSCRSTEGVAGRFSCKWVGRGSGGPLGTLSPFPLGFTALVPIRRGERQGKGRADVRPAFAVLAPGLALRSHPCVALSSNQVAGIVSGIPGIARASCGGAVPGFRESVTSQW